MREAPAKYERRRPEQGALYRVVRENLAEIERRYFATTAQRCGLGGDMDAIIDEVVERVPAVIDTVGAGLPEPSASPR